MSLIQSIASTSTPVHEDISGPSHEHEHEHEHEPFPSTSVVPATATAVPAAGEPEGELVKKVKTVRWGLKPIHWPPEQPERVLRIVTQNENGPCSFIAICNILILRGEIVITPPDRPSVSYEYLSTLLGDYLVNKCSDVDLDSVFSVLPKTQHGLDLNPLFTGISSFRPAGSGGELKLFELAGIRLVHGWLVDPDSQEHAALAKTEDYDTSVNSIVGADHLMSGRLVVAEHGDTPVVPDGDEAPGSHQELSPDQQEKITHALLIRQWLDANPTQLTYYGLFSLHSALEPNELVALFRGSHLSVLYKRQPAGEETLALYTLVTDRVFLRETSVVWESLEDVDGQSSTFRDSGMMKSSPAGGDWAGHTSEQIARMYEQREYEAAHSADLALARQLQAEEDAHARAAYEEHHRRQYEQQVRGDPRQSGPHNDDPEEAKKKKKKKNDCIIM